MLIKIHGKKYLDEHFYYDEETECYFISKEDHDKYIADTGPNMRVHISNAGIVLDLGDHVRLSILDFIEYTVTREKYPEYFL